MEQEMINNEVRELMADVQDRCAKQAKYYRFYTILLFAALLLVSFLALSGKPKDWITVALALAAVLTSALGVFLYGKMSNCGDAKQLLGVYKKVAKWIIVIEGCSGFFLGYFLGQQLAEGTHNERLGLVLYITSIVLIILLAFFMLFLSIKKKAIKNNNINPVRELMESND